YRKSPEYPHLYWLLSSAWIGQAVYVAAKLDIAQRLRERPMTVAELAKQCGAKETPLLQVLRSLAGYGIFEQRGEHFALTSKAHPLLEDDRWSVHAHAILWGEQLYPAASDMLQQVQDGVPAFKTHFGQTIWEFYADHPREAGVSDKSMSVATDIHNQFIPRAYNFPKNSVILDVGGGRASLISAILSANPQLRGIWLDRPELLEAAESRIAELGLKDRCEMVTGDFMQQVPSGADLYLLKHVLHDWTDESAKIIIKNIAAAMQPGSKLLIIEAVLDPRNRKDGLCKLRDLEQMFWTGGRVRTRVEFESLLRPAGLEIGSITATPIVDVCMIDVRRMS
ncbi:MAG: hypothetical protein L7T80_05770, partial [Arenicellales bacterium]|nr:hypothetical protein [Arenicellales bacterium]